MFKEILEYLLYKGKQIVTSRLFPLVLVFAALFAVLLLRVYDLQIVQGAEAVADVQDTTLRTVYLAPTRGNIYDRNGEILAHNELVQNITVVDNGDYANGYERNLMLLRLIDILDRYGETVVQSIPLYYDEDGRLQESFSSENARLRFLRDMYGKKSVDELTEEQRATTGQEIIDHYRDLFGIGEYGDGTVYSLSREKALACVYIRYSMYSNYFMRYNASVVARDVKMETIAAVRENAPQLLGVDVETSYKRVYDDPIVFSHIIGYTGYASQEELEELNADGSGYMLGDIVGKTGIEASMEKTLRGTPGYVTMYVNNLGQVRSVAERVEPVAGSNIYLSIDANLMRGIYLLAEKKLAGILLTALVNEDADPTSEEHPIPVKLVYSQLLNNNVLKIEHFAAEDAGPAEQRLYSIFSVREEEVFRRLRDELTNDDAQAYKDLSEDDQDYLDELYSTLLDKGLLVRANIDTSSETYHAYRVNGEISLREYLRRALELGWIDVTQLDLDDRYTSAELVYRSLMNYVIQALEESKRFSKLVYTKLINDDVISRNDIALAMYEQGIFKEETDEDSEWLMRLRSGMPNQAYNFIREKISDLSITPAQLALDPYCAAVTITDPSTGKVLAMVSYPGYDTNRISDGAYYRSLLEDQSAPLYNVATQAQTPPGSIFKMVTTATAIENGVIGKSTYLLTRGIFAPPDAGIAVKCWCYPDGSHGNITVTTALQESCNDFFAQAAYRFSLVNDQYSDSEGMSKLRYYAFLLGLGDKSGVELAESQPVVSDTSALTSAIGQGTHLYANSQLARYATTLTTRGNVYDLTLLDHTTAADGTLIQNFRGELIRKVNLKMETWDAIQEGMHKASHLSAMRWMFSGNVDMAAKTGTAEENETRPNHATFVSFAPYENPEITVAVTIPHGYASGHAATLGGLVFDYYFGYINLEQIQDSGALKDSGNTFNQ